MWSEAFLRDLFDRDPGEVDLPPGADPLGHPAALHALVFWKVWHSVMGVTPSSCEHCEYCEFIDALPAVDQRAKGGSGALDENAFKEFMQQRRRISIPPLTNMDRYVEHVQAREMFLSELRQKLSERYGKGSSKQDIAELHADVSSGAERDHADLLMYNPCTTHTMCETPSDRVAAFHRTATRRDALKFCFSRDYMFNTAASRGRGVFIGPDPRYQLEELCIILDVAADTSAGGPPILINCPIDEDALNFYHHRLLIQDKDEYDALPANFHRYLLVNSTRVASKCRLSGGSVWAAHDAKGVREPPGDYIVACTDARAGFDRLFVPEYEPSNGFLGQEALIKWVWKRVLGTRSSTLSRDPRDGVLMHEQYMLKRCFVDRSWSKYEICEQSPDARGVVVAVENRRDPGAALAVMTALCNLEPGWAVLVICAPEARDFYENVFDNTKAEVCVTKLLPSRCFNIECYNSLMKRRSTWELMRCRRALLVQADGTLVRPGLERHPAFASRYAGAPWRDQAFLSRATAGNLVGNGGLSVRDPAMCAEICDKAPRKELYPSAPSMTQAEDVYFSAHAHDVCSRADAVSFAMEQVYSMDCLGYHQFWNYHPAESCRLFFDTLWAETLVAAGG